MRRVPPGHVVVRTVPWHTVCAEARASVPSHRPCTAAHRENLPSVLYTHCATFHTHTHTHTHTQVEYMKGVGDQPGVDHFLPSLCACVCVCICVCVCHTQVEYIKGVGDQPGGDCFFFDYGVVACWGMTKSQEMTIVRGIARQVQNQPLPEK